VCLGCYGLDGLHGLRCRIELGEFVLPRAIFLHVLFYVLYHIAETFSFVMPCAFAMHIAKHSLHRIGPWTVRRQPEERTTRMACQPRLDGVRFMKTVVIHHDIHTCDAWSRVGTVQYGQKVAKQPMVFTRAQVGESVASGKMECPS